MELLQLLYFCHAAETENFAKTAREFSIPAASVSQTVKRLESEVGATLFDRSANTVKLNERGRILYRNAKSALSMLDDAKRAIRDEAISGTIRLLVETNRYIVSEAIGEFRKKHKGVSFVIDHALDCNRDNYDLIVTDNVPFRKKYSSYSFLNERILLALPCTHPLASEDKVSVFKLKDEQFICTAPESGLFTITRRICSCGAFEPNVTVTVSDPDTVMHSVAMGLGIAIVPETSWHALFDEKTVLKELCDVKAEHTVRPSRILCNADKYASKATRLFIDELIEIAKKYTKQ